jgi:1,2-phenylacetyl-CoA epoxidase PaaB subunit
MLFDVFDNDFKKVGTVQAPDPITALQKAKQQFKYVAAPMVQESRDKQ